MGIKHSIKIDDEVYQSLDAFKGKHETFSQAIDRLLTLLGKVGELRVILEGRVNFERWKREQMEKASPQESQGDSQEVPDLPVH